MKEILRDLTVYWFTTLYLPQTFSLTSLRWVKFTSGPRDWRVATFTCRQTTPLLLSGLVRMFKLYSKEDRVLTFQIKCFRNLNYLVIWFSQNIIKSKTVRNFFCAINKHWNCGSRIRQPEFPKDLHFCSYNFS